MLIYASKLWNLYSKTQIKQWPGLDGVCVHVQIAFSCSWFQCKLLRYSIVQNFKLELQFFIDVPNVSGSSHFTALEKAHQPFPTLSESLAFFFLTFHWKDHLKFVLRTEQKKKHTDFEYHWVKCDFILIDSTITDPDILFCRPAPSSILQPSDRRLWSTECELSRTPEFFFSSRLCIQTMLLYFLPSQSSRRELELTNGFLAFRWNNVLLCGGV